MYCPQYHDYDGFRYMIQIKMNILQYGNFPIFFDILVGYEIRNVLEFCYLVLETSNRKVLDMRL